MPAIKVHSRDSCRAIPHGAKKPSYKVMAFVDTDMAYVLMAYEVMAYEVMANVVMAYVVAAFIATLMTDLLALVYRL